MDFEIVGSDDDDDVDYESFNHSGSKGRQVQDNSKRKSYFGSTSHGKKDEDDVYSYSFDTHKAKPSKGKWSAADSLQGDSFNYEHDASKAKVSSRADGPVVTASSSSAGSAPSAMDKAQQVLSKYSNKSLNKVSSYNRPYRPQTFNEDDISVSSDDGASSMGGGDYEESEQDASNNSFAYKSKKVTHSSRSSVKSKGQMDINELGSKAVVFVDMEEGGMLQVPQLRRNVSDQTELSDYTVGLHSENDDDASSDGSHDYSGEQFDQLEVSEEEQVTGNGPAALDEDPAVPVDETTSQYTRIAYAVKDELDSDNDNDMSYSRLAYGLEEEVEEEEEQGMEESSKPKIISFADFDIPSWDSIAEEEEEEEGHTDDLDVSTAETAPALEHKLVELVEQMQVRGGDELPNQHAANSAPNQHTAMNAPNQHTAMNAPNQHTAINAPNQHTAMNAPSQHAAMNAPNQHTAMNAPNQHTAMNAPNQHTAMNAPNQHTAMNAPNQHTAMKAPNQHAAMNAPNQHTAMNAPNQHTGMNAPNQHTAMNAPNQHTAMTAPNQHTAMNAPNQHTAMNAPNQHTAMNMSQSSIGGTHLTIDASSSSSTYPQPAYSPPAPTAHYGPPPANTHGGVYYPPPLPDQSFAGSMYPPPGPAHYHPMHPMPQGMGYYPAPYYYPPPHPPAHPYFPTHPYPSPMYGAHPSTYLSGSASQIDPRFLPQIDPLAYSSLRSSSLSQQHQHQLGPNPLVLNLLEELQRSKEEAEWAKLKLAETLMRLDTHEESQLHQLRTGAVDPSSPGKDASSSPAKHHPSRGPHHVKGSLRPKASAPPTILESSSLDDDQSMLDDCYDYSSDFESVNRSMQPAPTAEGSGPAPATTANEPAPQQSLSSRDRVMQPLRENLARSLLASQDNFRSQLDSLRLRVQMTNSYSNVMSMRMNDQWDRINRGLPPRGPAGVDSSSGGNYSDNPFQPPPSLRDIKSGFDRKRVDSTEKMFDLLMKIYPTMSKDDAYQLVMKL